MGLFRHKMISFFKTWPLHVLLLPIFFILNINLRFAGLLDKSVAFKYFIIIAASLALLSFILHKIYKNKAKSGLLATTCGILFLYFGDIKNGLAGLPIINLVTHNIIFLPLFFLFLIFIFYKIPKLNISARLTFFLNLLFFMYLAIEFVKWQSFNQKENSTAISSHLNDTPEQDSLQTKKKIDIIYILLDCYPSISYQEEMLGKHHHYLDSSLKEMGFFVVNNSKSNYNRTAFSMASTFQLDYVPWLHNNMKVEPYHYNKALELVKNGPLFTTLSSYKYQFNNLSIFDFADQPALKKLNFLATSTKEIILYNTFINTIRRQILWHLSSSLEKSNDDIIKRNKELLSFTKDYNWKVADSLVSITSNKTSSPRFIYSHFLMPHFPYFYDSSGNANSDNEIYGNGMITDSLKFKGYINYTDRTISTLVQSLLKKIGQTAILIIQSDHGLSDLDEKREKDAFRNYSAFYFPDKKYDALYSGMSNVNTFRIILNKYFEQHLPLLKDSSVYIAL